MGTDLAEAARHTGEKVSPVCMVEEESDGIVAGCTAHKATLQQHTRSHVQNFLFKALCGDIIMTMYVEQYLYVAYG